VGNDEAKNTAGTKIKKPYLTETILSIHHEVQSAMDYIASVAAKEGTELGKSSAVMNIERIRLKVPIRIRAEEKTRKVGTTTETLQDFRRNLMDRKGFLTDTGEQGKRGLYTKMIVDFIPPGADKKNTENQNDTGSSEWLEGEIELVFVPLQRE
jgi:hypothetical protein